MMAGMSPRVRNWAIGLGVADAAVWVLTVHAHLSFHRSKHGPSVMPVGQLLGWAFSILLLIALVLLLLAARADSKYRRADAPRRHE
jgi:hypothetical protein